MLPLRVSPNPPPESIETNRIEYHWHHKSVLIGYGTRMDPVQPEKDSIPWMEVEEVMHPFLFLGRTELPDRTGTKNISFDADGPHRRRRCVTNFRTTACWCRDMCKIYRSYCSGWRGPGFRMEPEHVILHTVGTERMTTSSLLPFRPFTCSLQRAKTRPPEFRTPFTERHVPALTNWD